MSEDTQPLFLGGEWHGTAANAAMEVRNPATEELVAVVLTASEDDVRIAARRAGAAQPAWERTPVPERATVLEGIARLVERDAEELAQLVVAEQGKTITEARGEVGSTAEFFRFFAAQALTMSGEILPAAGRDQELWVRRRAQGVVAGIVPWNYPLALSARKLAPALATGNALLLKPHELTPLSALALAERAHEAGLPPGLLSVLPGDGRVTGAALVRMSEVAFITMTGSVRAGREILADAARRIVPVSLELGGKAPFVVFPDADLDEAADAAVAMRILNCGQTCVCNERTYLHAEIHDELLNRIAARMAEVRMGDPADEATQLGPKVSAPELDKVRELVDAAVREGARVVTGGGSRSGAGYERGHWIEPTVLADVAQSSPAMRQEIFGPVLPVARFSTEEEAIALANDSAYGLSAYLFTTDLGRVMRMLDELKVGEVFVNRAGPEEVAGFHTGWGESGLGGDDGRHGLELYLRKQSAYIRYERRPGSG